MERFSLGHASGADWGAAARAAVNDLPAAGGKANLGFVYVTHEVGDDVGKVLDLLKSVTEIESWVGAVGIGICASGCDYFDEPAVAILTGQFPEGSFGIFDTERDEKDEAGISSARLDDINGPHFGVVHGDPSGPEILRVLPEFANATQSFLVGGLSSPETMQSQVADTVTSGGLSGVLFSDKVPVATGLSQGCQPIGPVREITECRSTTAVKIDSEPALDVLLRDAGSDAPHDLQKIGGTTFVAFLVEGSDRGDYVVRNLVGIDEKNALIGIGAPLEQGQKMMFCRRDVETARGDLRRMLTELHGRAGDTPRGGIYYSCVARGPHLFGPGAVEPNMIAEEFGDLPFIGFYGSGEISHNRLYTQTGVLSLFL